MGVVVRHHEAPQVTLSGARAHFQDVSFALLSSKLGSEIELLCCRRIQGRHADTTQPFVLLLFGLNGERSNFVVGNG